VRIIRQQAPQRCVRSSPFAFPLVPSLVDTASAYTGVDDASSQRGRGRRDLVVVRRDGDSWRWGLKEDVGHWGGFVVTTRSAASSAGVSFRLLLPEPVLVGARERGVGQNRDGRRRQVKYIDRGNARRGLQPRFETSGPFSSNCHIGVQCGKRSVFGRISPKGTVGACCFGTLCTQQQQQQQNGFSSTSSS